MARPAHLSNCYVSALHILGADSLATRQLRLRLENEHGTEEHVAQLVVGAQWRRVGAVVKSMKSRKSDISGGFTADALLYAPVEMFGPLQQFIGAG